MTSADEREVDTKIGKATKATATTAGVAGGGGSLVGAGMVWFMLQPVNESINDLQNEMEALRDQSLSTKMIAEKGDDDLRSEFNVEIAELETRLNDNLDRVELRLRGDIHNVSVRFEEWTRSVENEVEDLQSYLGQWTNAQAQTNGEVLATLREMQRAVELLADDRRGERGNQ